MSPIYISLAEAARLAGLSRKYLNVLVWRKRIRVEKIGGQWFMTLRALNDYLRSVHRLEISAEAAARAAVANAETNPAIEQRMDALSEKIDKLADGIRGGELSSPDRFADAYIQQTKFLQEQFGKMMEERLAAPQFNVAEVFPPAGEAGRPPWKADGDLKVSVTSLQSDSIITDLQARIDALHTELHEEQTDKQALLFELQRLHEQMEETIAHRLAEMADDLNRKIMDAKVTERLERLQEKFDEKTKPIEETPSQSPPMTYTGGENTGANFSPSRPPAGEAGREGGDEEGVREPEPPLLPLPVPSEAEGPETHNSSQPPLTLRGGASELVPLRSTPIHRKAKYHTLRIWDHFRGTSLPLRGISPRQGRRIVVVPVAILAALFVVNFASANARVAELTHATRQALHQVASAIGRSATWPAELGLAYGDAVLNKLQTSSSKLQIIAKSQIPNWELGLGNSLGKLGQLEIRNLASSRVAFLRDFATSLRLPEAGIPENIAAPVKKAAASYQRTFAETAKIKLQVSKINLPAINFLSLQDRFSSGLAFLRTEFLSFFQDSYSVAGETTEAAESPIEN